MAITVLLVEDQEIIRTSLTLLLEKIASIKLLADTADGKTAIELVEKLRPQIVLMDVRLKGSEINGFQATRKITELWPETKVIALSTDERLQTVKSMLSAGADGYLSKDCSYEDLVKALETITAGENYFSPVITRQMEGEFISSLKSGNDKKHTLSEREIEILKHLAIGNSSKEIGKKLFLSSKTVDTHKRNIMQKLELYTIAELTRYAISLGLEPDDD